MAGAKLIVIYPAPKDVAEFETVYTQEHAPMVTSLNLKGLTKFTATRILGTADGSPAPFYRIAELHFGSIETLQAAAASPGGQAAAAHAASISTSGQPLLLVAEEEIKTF